MSCKLDVGTSVEKPKVFNSNVLHMQLQLCEVKNGIEPLGLLKVPRAGSSSVVTTVTMGFTHHAETPPLPPHPQSSSHVSLIYLDFGNQSSRASTKSSRFLLAESTFLSRREYFPALGLSSTLKSTGIKSSRNGRGIQKP